MFLSVSLFRNVIIHKPNENMYYLRSEVHRKIENDKYLPIVDGIFRSRFLLDSTFLTTLLFVVYARSFLEIVLVVVYKTQWYSKRCACLHLSQIDKVLIILSSSHNLCNNFLWPLELWRMLYNYSFEISSLIIFLRNCWSQSSKNACSNLFGHRSQKGDRCLWMENGYLFQSTTAAQFDLISFLLLTALRKRQLSQCLLWQPVIQIGKGYSLLCLQ